MKAVKEVGDVKAHDGKALHDELDDDELEENETLGPRGADALPGPLKTS
jgi:hypothetical protein